MKKEKLYISSIADDAPQVAERFDLGLEVAEYCTAYNMDDNFLPTDKSVREKLGHIKNGRMVFHGPFNELSPAAIDPRILDVTRERYIQAIELAKSYGINKLVIHSGFSADMYFPEWFEERSTEFWKAFLRDVSGEYEILYENVFERTPEQLVSIVRAVDNERFKLCFDIGHANVITEKKTVLEWLSVYAPHLSHFHIHNNYGKRDEHNGLADGNIDMKAFLALSQKLCPDATYTMETLHCEPSVLWLADNGFIN